MLKKILTFGLVSLLYVSTVDASGSNVFIRMAELQGNTITLSGEGFSDENPMLFWDDGDDSFIGQKAKSGDVVKTGSGYKWGANGNKWGNPFHFLQTQTRSGEEGIVYYGTGHKNFLGKPYHAKPTSLNNQIYVSWWYKPGKSPLDEGGANKFIRIWDDTNGLGTRISWTQMLFGACEQQKVSWKNWTGKSGEWNKHEIYVDYNVKNIKTWVNGTLEHDYSGCPKNLNTLNKPLYVEVLGFDHGMEAYQGMTTQMDGIYIGKNLSRVEVSNDMNWSQTMKKEVLPVVNWSNSKIEVQLISGIVDPKKDMYIYMYDANGNVNNEGVIVDKEVGEKPLKKVLQIDLQGKTGVTQTGWLSLAQKYDTINGFGWILGGFDTRLRNGPLTDAMRIDGHHMYGKELNFEVRNLEMSNYKVIVHMYDHQYGHDTFDLYVNGNLVQSNIKLVKQQYGDFSIQLQNTNKINIEFKKQNNLGSITVAGIEVIEE